MSGGWHAAPSTCQGLISCQFSGAVFHPVCYDYPEKKYNEISDKLKEIRDGIKNNSRLKCNKKNEQMELLNSLLQIMGNAKEKKGKKKKNIGLLIVVDHSKDFKLLYIYNR